MQASKVSRAHRRKEHLKHKSNQRRSQKKNSVWGSRGTPDVDLRLCIKRSECACVQESVPAMVDQCFMIVDRETVFLSTHELAQELIINPENELQLVMA
jgi:hypothetical protein